MVQDGKPKTELQMAREQKRIEKEKEKAAKQAKAAVAKGMKRENWMDYMQVLIDSKIAEDKGGTEMLTTLELEGMKCDVISQPLPNTISFIRFELSADDGIVSKTKIFEDTVLLVEQAETVAAHVQSDNLVTHVRQCISILSEHVTCTVTLLVLGFDKLMKSKRKGTINRLDWEQGVVALQMELNVSTYIIKDTAQLVDNVRMYCKALGERPHKLKHHKDLFIGTSKTPLFVDREGGGYLQVFIAQLQDIRSVNEAVATAVAQQYPSPVILSNYIDSTDKDTVINTLAGIPVRRGVGTLANVRRVGPEAAKRIVLFYSSSDPLQEIV
ncbi:crossover junction endonuclease EME1-like [Bolinopsis microptera]|uniref:crossover junction endonuclease EME1-like n=1 Tax=Bolinopsis microptera TaxID=2820187 RepID=UPI00307A9E63